MARDGDTYTKPVLPLWGKSYYELRGFHGVLLHGDLPKQLEQAIVKARLIA